MCDYIHYKGKVPDKKPYIPAPRPADVIIKEMYIYIIARLEKRYRVCYMIAYQLGIENGSMGSIDEEIDSVKKPIKDRFSNTRNFFSFFKGRSAGEKRAQKLTRNTMAIGDEDSDETSEEKKEKKDS
jgi:hypothetical protein